MRKPSYDLTINEIFFWLIKKIYPFLGMPIAHKSSKWKALLKSVFQI